MNGFHLRITGSKEVLKPIIEFFIKKFDPTKYLFGFEQKDDNRHVHGHLEFENPPARQRISDFFKKHFNDDIISGRLYYFKAIAKSKEANILYAMKEQDIITHNLTDEEYGRLMQKTKEIEEDKKLDQRHKLLNSFTKSLETKVKILEETQKIINRLEAELDKDKKNIERLTVAKQEYRHHFEEVTKLSYISRFIHKVYVTEYDKEPPLNHIRGYTLYIASKYNGNDKIRERLQSEVDAYYERMFPE